MHHLHDAAKMPQDPCNCVPGSFQVAVVVGLVHQRDDQKSSEACHVEVMDFFHIRDLALG